MNMDNSLANRPISMGNHPDAPPTGQDMTGDLNGTNNVVPGEPEVPVKRRPGRPKGSGKKSLDLSPPVPKIKRPVGRPRKDGFPAGSVGPRRSARPRKSAPAKLGDSELASQAGPTTIQFSGAYYPQAAGQQQPWQGTYVAHEIAVDPNLDRDHWAELARTKPSTFLSNLLNALYAPNPTSSAGPSVEEAFKSHLVSLAPKPDQAKGSQPIPSLYSILKTFWLPSSPSYFSLTASTSTPRTPSEHRFLYWDPQPLVFNGIACPNCSVPLLNKGRIRSGPIKVYDLENPFFIIGCEYVCKSPACVANTTAEGRKFASTDQAILRSLPSRLRDEFPAHLLHGESYCGSGPNVWNWQALGVSRSLWNMVRGCLKVGLGKEAIFQVLQAIQLGVSDNDTREEEEADEPEEEEDDDIRTRTIPQEETDPRMRMVATAPVADKPENTMESYHNAWKANTAMTNTPVIQAAGPSNPASAAPVAVAPAAVPPQGYALPQQSPYANLPIGYYTYFQQHLSSQPPGPQSHPGNVADPNHNTIKRPFTFATDGTGASDGTSMEPSQKRTRHCCKCGSQDCKGKGGRSFCMNVCQDCGKLECKGRNSRRPDKRCAEAWT